MSRLLVTGIFAAMTAATAMTVGEAVRDAISDPHARSWAVVGYSALRLAVVGAFSYFVFVRAPSRQPSRNAVALIACTVAVTAVVLLQKPAEDGSAALIVAGDVAALASCAWLLISVLTLGRCFGVLPEVRGLVREGPYRLVRHPVYLGEFGACAGLVLAAPTAWNLVIAALFAGAQAVRMRLEERALAAEFPEYTAYAHSTPALIPVLRASRGRVSRLRPEMSTTHVRKGSP